MSGRDGATNATALTAARAFIERAQPPPDMLLPALTRMVCELRRHALAVLEIADRQCAALDATTEALARLVVDYQDLAAASPEPGALAEIRAVLAELDGCDGWDRHQLEFALARIAQIARTP